MLKLCAVGSIGFFWIVIVAVRKSMDLTRHSVSITSSAISAYSSAWQARWVNLQSLKMQVNWFNHHAYPASRLWWILDMYRLHGRTHGSWICLSIFVSVFGVQLCIVFIYPVSNSRNITNNIYFAHKPFKKSLSMLW